MKCNVNLQYQGYINTPTLWASHLVEGLHQFEIDKTVHKLIQPQYFNEIRLGKRVEQFLSFQLSQSPNIEILAENIQIKNGLQTIGELDVLAIHDNKPIHIETVYKFYLFDTTINSNSYIDNWIGPNQKDTLMLKLDKLKTKQLPLLYSKYTTDILHQYSLSSQTILQYVHFKAQLFVPYKQKNINVSPLQPQSIYGIHFNQDLLPEFQNYLFYIPKKIDWLIDVHDNVPWKTYTTAIKAINNYIIEERSPMLWLKDKQNNIFKGFVTWW